MSWRWQALRLRASAATARPVALAAHGFARLQPILQVGAELKL